MEESFSVPRNQQGGQVSRGIVQSSTDKALRTVRLAILLQVSWPTRLTRQEMIEKVGLYGESARQRGLYRDLETLTGMQAEDLPSPDDDRLDQWCGEQYRLRRLAITYERGSGTFALVRPAFTLDISEDEARAFILLKRGFTPGTPYAESVNRLLQRWEWLFSEKSHKLAQQKSKRAARPVLLPLSPVVDYSQHGEVILKLDQALEEGAYISFAYVPLTQSWDDEPVRHEYTEPYELEYRDGHWYYTAYVRDLNTFIDYRVDRIQPSSVHKENDRFYPGARERKGVHISYWVSPMLARHNSLSARLRDQHVTLLADDQGAIVKGYAKSVWWARRLLLGYGEQVKALSPEALVQMMRETTSAMNGLYEEEK